MTVKLQAGDVAPDFSLPSSTGEELSLEGFRGKKVVVFFYQKDDTPGCTKEACGFRDAESDLGDEDVVVLGVSADDLDSHKKFVDKFDLNFPLLADVDKSVINSYGVWGEKNNYGKKSMGIIRKTFLIDENGKIIKAWHKVSPEGHADDILNIVRGAK